MDRDPYLGDTIVVPDERHGVELDEYLCLQYPGVPKSFLRRMIRQGRVLIDGTAAKTSQRLRGGQVLLVDLDEEELPARPVAPRNGLEVLYEDETLLVLDKPAGIAVEPERWARQLPSLAGALVALAEERLGEGAGQDPDLRFRLAHRIDKDTTGCLLVAKTLEAERSVRRAFQEGRVHKEYLALVEGEHPLADEEEELIEAAIGPDPRKSGRMVVSSRGKPSRTWIGVGRRDELMLSSIKADYRAKPGRPERPLVGRLTLHAHVLGVPAVDGRRERVHVEAPLPKDLRTTLKQLRKVRPARGPNRNSR